MKTIKQIISDADPRLKGVLVIMVVYVMVMATTVTSGATQEIKGYKETIEIQYQDGGQQIINQCNLLHSKQPLPGFHSLK